MLQNIKKVWAIVQNKDWKILIFREKLEYNDKALFNIPKWTVDLQKDKTLSNALKREIKEETNLEDIVIEDVLDIYFKNKTDTISVLLIFKVLVTDISDLSNKNLENDEEISDYRWIDHEDFAKMNKKEFVDDRAFGILVDFFANS